MSPAVSLIPLKGLRLLPKAMPPLAAAARWLCGMIPPAPNRRVAFRFSLDSIAGYTWPRMLPSFTGVPRRVVVTTSRLDFKTRRFSNPAPENTADNFPAQQFSDASEERGLDFRRSSLTEISRNSAWPQGLTKKTSNPESLRKSLASPPPTTPPRSLISRLTAQPLLPRDSEDHK